MSEGDGALTSAVRKLMLSRHPEWARLIADDGGHEVGDAPAVVLTPPVWPGHRLSIEVASGDAMLAYSDGAPPGPAESLFVRYAGAPDDAADAIVNQVEAIVGGRVVMVRVRLSWLFRALRRHDCESLLRFVVRDQLDRWPPRRRAAIVSAWSWGGDRIAGAGP